VRIKLINITFTLFIVDISDYYFQAYEIYTFFKTRKKVKRLPCFRIVTQKMIVMTML